MNSLLEIAEARQQFYPLSVESYRTLGDMGLIGDDVELLRGILITKMVKSPLHQIVIRLLVRLLTRLISDAYDIQTENPISTADSEPEPDLSVVQWQPEKQATEHPKSALLVVEVSVSTLNMDRAKAEIYASAGVPEYWIVRPEDREVDVYRDPQNGVFQKMQTFTDYDTLLPVSLPGVSLRVAEILPAKP